jgi:Icc-related predicted phosphoesterase
MPVWMMTGRLLCAYWRLRIFSGNHVGSHALAGLLGRTNVLCHIHGHIHHSFGRAENHFNVAADGRRRAMIIDIPSLSHFVIEGR